MAEYTTLATGSVTTLEITDDTTTFRVQVRGTSLYFDKALTDTGFDGAENTDWSNIDSSSLPGSSEENFRIGARSGDWVIDQAITGDGFGGSEGVDWDEIESHRL